MEEIYKFQKLQVYKMALGYVEAVYTLTQVLPVVEKYNLTSQVQRAATSIALNIAEGSTGQSDLEQNRFLGLALRSYLETVACLDIIEQQSFTTAEDLKPLRDRGHQLFIKLSALRKTLKS